ncbi:MAG: hypothetical protein KDD53_03090 [Bdellovibrionales bacterium]|nr:hypothetical protein [Bdellovibrionales bacterium]
MPSVKLPKGLKKSLTKSRPVRESRSVLTSMLLVDLRAFTAPFLHSMALILLVVSYYALGTKLSFLSYCELGCFVNQDPSCCSIQISTSMFLVFLGSISYYSIMRSCSRIKTGKLRYSATVTAFSLLEACLFGIIFGTRIWMVISISAIFFFTHFYGYQQSLQKFK